SRALAWMKKRPSMVCRCCGGEMEIVKTRLPPLFGCFSVVVT
ncbi:MAG: hypothetical protein ACI9FJ_003346, partial [Alteromonadaceae bacterium]